MALSYTESRSSQRRQTLSLVTFFLALCGLTVVSNVYVAIPIAGDIARAFHVSKSAAVLASSVFSLFYALGILVFGPLADRFGDKPVMAYGLGSLTISTLVVGFAHTFSMLLVFRGLQGFIAATFAPSALAYVFEVYPIKSRPTSIAFISTGFLMSGIIGQLLSAWITHTFGWDKVFFLFAAIYLVMFLLMLKIPPNPVNQGDTHLVTAWLRMFRVFLHPNLVKAYVITFTLFLSFVGMYSSISGFLTTHFQLTPAQMIIFRSVGIIGMLLSPLAGRFAHRYGFKKIVVVGLILSAIGIVLERELPSPTLIAAASVVFVAGISMLVPALINAVGIMGGQMRGSAVAMYTFILFLGASAGPIMASFGGFMEVSFILIGVLTLSFILSLTLNIESEVK